MDRLKEGLHSPKCLAHRATKNALRSRVIGAFPEREKMSPTIRRATPTSSTNVTAKDVKAVHKASWQDRTSQISEEMLNFLVNVVKMPPPIVRGHQLPHSIGVAAAREVLMHIRWHEERKSAPESVLLQLCGSEAALLDWMKVTIPKLEARQALLRETAALEREPALLAEGEEQESPHDE